MKRLRFVIIAPAIVLLCSAASAQETSTQKAEAPKEKKTCRRLTPTGTIMPTRVCNTEAAWRAFDRYTADGADQFHNAMRMTGTGQQK